MPIGIPNKQNKVAAGGMLDWNPIPGVLFVGGKRSLTPLLEKKKKEGKAQNSFTTCSRYRHTCHCLRKSLIVSEMYIQMY
jgi:hypothetical protein